MHAMYCAPVNLQPIYDTSMLNERVVPHASVPHNTSHQLLVLLDSKETKKVGSDKMCISIQVHTGRNRHGFGSVRTQYDT
jgi:hypothetical protein